MLYQLRGPHLIASRSGRIIAANAACAEALGTSIAVLEGAPLASFAPDPTAVTAQLEAPVESQFALRARDGRRCFADARLLGPDLLLFRISDGARIEAIIDPASQPRGPRGIATSEIVSELAHVLLAYGMRSVHAPAGGVFLIDEAGANLELKASVGFREENADRFRLVPLTAQLPLTDAIGRREPIVLGTVEAYASRYPAFAKAHPQIASVAMACVPLQVDDRAIGVLGLGFPMPKQLTDPELATLREFAALWARMLETTRAAEAGDPRAFTERTTTQLARLHAFTRALAQAITPVEVTEAVVDIGIAVTSARAGGLWLRSRDGATVCLARGVGAKGPATGTFTDVPLEPPGRMPILDAIRTGTPVWIESCRQLEQRYPEMARAFAHGGESSLACVPLFAQGRSIGGLAFNFEGRHVFLEDERAFLQVLCWHSAQAIERSRLFAAEHRARAAAEANQRRSDFLADASRLLASSLDYSSTLAGVAEAAVPRVADWCIVELEDERLQGKPPVAAHVDPSKVPFVLEISHRYRRIGEQELGIPGVIRSGKPQLYSSITSDQIRTALSPLDPELAELFIQTGVASSMVVPISARGRTLGAILLNNTDPSRRYDELDLAMGVELGVRAGLAVDNARLYRDAREADRLKDEFLAMLSHELRNPLAPIVTTLQLMELRGGNVFARERAIISRHLDHVLRLVGDLLDVARITRGKIALQKERCEIAAVIAKALEMVTPHIEGFQHQVTVLAPEAGLPLIADPARLAQAIANLLTNAAKCTEPGGRIVVTGAAEGSEVVVRVRDTGMGIAPDFLPKVFDLFVQADSSIDRARGGLGIGLTVVKGVVDLHGGSVSAASEGLGHGSEFTIRLPLAGSDDVATPTAAVMSGTLATPCRVLIVDDNVDAATTISELLEALGCTARVAHDGASALVVAAEFKPELALLDLGLPVMNGYELARRLRDLGVPPSRIVAVTGYGAESDHARSREAGFDEHVVKPVEIAILREILARQVGHRG